MFDGLQNWETYKYYYLAVNKTTKPKTRNKQQYLTIFQKF